MVTVLTAIGTWLLDRVVTLLWNVAKRFPPLARRLPIRLKAWMYASITYAPDVGIFLSAPAEAVRDLNTTEAALAIPNTPESAYLSDTPFVAVFQNRGAEVLRIRELTVELKEWWPVERVTRNAGVVGAGTIQAGGRGSEGDFVIGLRGTDSIKIPVIAQWSAEHDASSRGLAVHPDHHAEITIHFAPETEGRFTFTVGAEVEGTGGSRKVSLGDWRILHATDFSWIREARGTFNWTEPRRIEPDSVRASTDRLVSLRRAIDWSGVPDDRRVKIEGQLSLESWG